MANLNIMNKEWAALYLATQEIMSPSLGEEGDHRTKKQKKMVAGCVVLVSLLGLCNQDSLFSPVKSDK